MINARAFFESIWTSLWGERMVISDFYRLKAYGSFCNHESGAWYLLDAWSPLTGIGIGPPLAAPSPYATSLWMLQRCLPVDDNNRLASFFYHLLFIHFHPLHFFLQHSKVILYRRHNYHMFTYYYQHVSHHQLRLYNSPHLHGVGAHRLSLPRASVERFAHKTGRVQQHVV